jgi:UDP-N-acetyl-D-mannosaminuronic acid dehydrogenase
LRGPCCGDKLELNRLGLNLVMRIDLDSRVAVLGLGYVGLTLGTALAEVGFSVTGIEVRQDIVDMTNRGIPHFSEEGLTESLSRVTKRGNFDARCDFSQGEHCDVYIITVGTPLDSRGTARLDMIERATKQVADHMSNGALVILRSTVKIGTSRNVVAPILLASGKKFDLAMCPERTLEGRALEELRELPQIVGSDTEVARDRAAKIFGRLTNTIVRVSSLESAEIIKLVDNTFRDVQFAFANEVAKVCEVFDVNAMEVINSGKLGYRRTNVPMPGLVGGPCLEKDPHILMQSVNAAGVELGITRASRIVNETQPVETVNFIVKEAQRRAIKDNCSVALMGLAFKGEPATDDLRGSMSLKVLHELTRAFPQQTIRLFDPVIHAVSLRNHLGENFIYPASFEEAVAGASIIVIANNHPKLGKIKPVQLYDMMGVDGFIYDYWNHFSNLSSEELAGSYFSVGNVRRSDA